MVRGLVIGATGYVGSATVAELARRGMPVIAHVRFDSPQLGKWREHFAAISAEVATTPWRRDAFAELVQERDVTHVFLCVATNLRRRLGRSTSSIPDRARDVDLGLSVLVIEACAASERKPVIVLVSAVGANARSWVPYWRIRGRLEQALRRVGLDFVIVRPAFISGPDRPERRLFEKLGAAAIDAGLYLLAQIGVRRLRARYRSIDATTLARALVERATDPAARGRLVRGEELRPLLAARD